jgi:hypothetical protein
MNLYKSVGISLRIVKATVLADGVEDADRKIAKAWDNLSSYDGHGLEGVEFEFDDDECYDDLESFPSAEPVNLAVDTFH